MNRRLLSAAALLAVAVAAEASLDALVDEAAFFSVSADTVEQAAAQRGEWLDAADSRTLRLRRPAYRGTPVAEALLQFAPGGTPRRAQVLLYSRGDDGPCTGRDFVARVATVQSNLDAIAGAPGVKRNVPANSRLVELRSWEWASPRAVYRLDVASQGRAANLQGEFIRLWILPPAAPAAPSPLASARVRTGLSAPASPASPDRSTRRDRANKADLLPNLVRNGSAVTIANIPMVDQGDKGYCAPATLARLLAYYGIATIDQHELAASMGTATSSSGTSSSAWKKAMGECGQKFGLRLDEIDELDYRDYERLIHDYNNAARKRGAPRIENRGGAPVVGEPFWELADGPSLRDARADSPQKQRAWLKKAREYLDAGIPVVWGVYCGLLPEQGRMVSGRGGHLRLLVGYDEAQSLVYYSDTWGPGHECKPMPLADAIAITRSRFVLRPRW